MSAYYNELDPFNVQWLKHLMAAKVIAPGEIDGRDIRDVVPSDLRGFTQCHFFAGIGVWSYALRLAGWADDRPVWTGSCPCPTFSCAGKGDGFDDPRHLWPAWERLIPERGAAAIFGEQSDGAIGFGWLDLVQTDLERKGYAVGKAVFGACSVGAPHERSRLYFVGDGSRTDSNGADKHGRLESFKMGRGRSARQDETIPDASRDLWAVGSKPAALAYGITCRMEQLRGYGNAIVAPQAEAFIRAYMEISATEGLRP